MPTPYPFQSGATLLASQMNSLSQLPTVSITANSTAVATHAYSRVIANGSAITYTIPDSVFEAGQVIEFHNINSTACTIAAGAGVTLNAAAGTTVAQYQSATIYATSASSFILFESDITASAGGLVYLTGATFTSATSFSLPNSTFTSTYRNYRIIVDATTNTSNSTYTLRYRASGSDNTTSNYFQSSVGINAAGSGVNVAEASATSHTIAIQYGTFPWSLVLDIVDPQQAQKTRAGGVLNYAATDPQVASRNIHLWFDATTAFDSLSIISSVASNMSGVYRVYGYADS